MNSPATTGDGSERASPEALAERVKSAAHQAGFELAGIAAATEAPSFPRLQEWLRQGFAAEMAYMERREQAYAHPRGVLPAVRSLIMLGMNYRQPDSSGRQPGRVAKYARLSEDYHDLLRRRMRKVASVLHEARPGCRTRCIADTAPLLERDFAQLAGLGWIGKNTMLINRSLGSWFVLGAIMTDVVLAADAPHATSHCGTCTRCLDACPTGAFPQAHVLDASRCISYLTIELRGRIVPEELRAGIGDWLFGCDVCNDVCPWNRKAPLAAHEILNHAWQEVDPADVLQMSEEEFQRRFAGTPLLRPGRAGLAQNACIVLGNSGNPAFRSVLQSATHDSDEVVREAAAWALRRIEELNNTSGLAGGTPAES